MRIRQYLVALGALAVAASMLAGCDRSSGRDQRTTGHIEAGVGKLTGDAHLKHQGQKDEVVGGVRATVSDVKGAVKDATH